VATTPQSKQLSALAVRMPEEVCGFLVHSWISSEHITPMSDSWLFYGLQG
jgi:hypothetical protein